MIGDRERAWYDWSGTALPAPPPGEQRAFNAGWDAGYRQAVKDRIALMTAVVVLCATVLILVLLAG